MTGTAAQQNSALLTINDTNLERIGERIQVPDYDRSAVTCGIMHMSVGGFHRAHQAVYTDDILNEAPEWGICGIGMLPQDKDHVGALQNQDTLYTVLERSAGMDVARIIGAMKEIIHAPAHESAVLQRLCDPAIKILSLTITEKGYCYDEKGDLNEMHPMVQNDLANPDTPQTAMGYIVAALRQRKTDDTAPFTVMSCDNLPGNGDLTKKIVLQFCDLADKDLKSWIDENVSFPNAMVDRITPVTTPEVISKLQNEFGLDDGWPVICEDFRQWVLEDKFCNGRPPWENAGVQLVPDVEPYEKMKVRLLNGSHSALSYISYLLGHRDVDAAMVDPLVSEFVRRYMDEDITPSVPDVPGIDLKDYKDTLITRFSNPGIRDQVQRLAEDGSQKIPNAILPCIRYQLEHGGSVKWAALALAGWFKYLTGVDEKLQPIEIKDPLSEKLTARAKIEPDNPVPLLNIKEIFGDDLVQSEHLVTEIKAALEGLNKNGAAQTLKEYFGA